MPKKPRYNEKKIMLMSKLAVYDKNDGLTDRQTDKFFRHDYVYRKNMWTRFYAFIGCIILLFMYWLCKFLLDGVDVFMLNYKNVLMNALVFTGIVLAAYSLIGSFVSLREYNASKKRLEAYYSLLDKLK